uniref:AC4 n=1 Tax=Opuntia virus 1 TaxID=2706523 RepID=A0A6C0M9A4_9GEMI|nr:AC4 [Opuntia virus 1]
MGNLISMCLSNSNPNSSAKIIDSSIFDTPNSPFNSIQTFNPPSPPPTAKLIWRKTEMYWILEFSK